jgi:hypothetical protein
MTPETRTILADLGASFLLLLVFVALCLATVVLYLVWRGVKMGRVQGPVYMVQVLDYIRAAEDSARDLSETSIEPQVRIVTTWAGLKAGARALIHGPGAFESPPGEDESPPV